MSATVQANTEGLIRFRKSGHGNYLVYSDCVTGEMQFVGYMDRVGQRWHGRIPGHPARFTGHTRLEAAERMVRA